MSRASISTRSGRELDLLDPQPSSIVLEDIAVGLARASRFSGQTAGFFSVAQHSVIVATAVKQRGREEIALAALFHDAHEAFVCDVPTPLEELLGPRYGEVTARIDSAIAETVGFHRPEVVDAESIKAVDQAALWVEGQALFDPPLRGPEVANADVAAVRWAWDGSCWSPEKAERQFTAACRRLGGLAGGRRSASLSQADASLRRAEAERAAEPPRTDERLLSTPGKVLAAIYLDPRQTIAALSSRVGVNERTVRRCLDSLEEDGILARARSGRSNRYTINLEAPFGAGGTVGSLLEMVMA